MPASKPGLDAGTHDLHQVCQIGSGDSSPATRERRNAPHGGVRVAIALTNFGLQHRTAVRPVTSTTFQVRLT
ncbi:hypothetical protein ACFFX0_27805 [Citricoccus parietis]|uniref:Uncharacterized protein n=1 Tax=Citricoccus parietis TaxID=592307 RepID=A0ABV5G764_9MICC